MEARTRSARAFRGALRAIAWGTAGLILSAAVAWVLSPRWVDVCTPLNYRRSACAAIDAQRMLGYVTTALGLILMTVGPVITTLWKLFRHGYNWETSHVEPAHVNGPIVFGLVYFIGGLLIVSMS